MVTGEPITTKENIEKCLEYVTADNLEIFQNLMKKLKVYRKFVKYGVYKNFEDNKCRNIYRFTFERNNKTTSIMFGDSLNATSEGTKPDLYEILTCVGSDLAIYENSESFEDFCNELGYNEDSIKALKIYRQLEKQYHNFIMKKILSSVEIFSLPN